MVLPARTVPEMVRVPAVGYGPSRRRRLDVVKPIPRTKQRLVGTLLGRMVAGTAALGALLAATPNTGYATTVSTAGAWTLTFYGSGETDGVSTGVQDWNAAQMNDTIAAANLWANRIHNTPGRQIQVHLFWYAYTGGTLGGTQTPTNGDGTTAWTYPQRIWADRVNYTGTWTGYDTRVRMDTDAAGVPGGWYFGSGSASGTQIDYRSVVIHELAHSLGFTSTYDSSSYDDWGNVWGTSTSPTAWVGYRGLTRWDKNLLDSSGNRPLSGSTGTPGNFNQLSDPVYFTGPYAKAAYGNVNVPVYAPNPWESGSSLSHVDQSTLPNAVMSPSVGTGLGPRDPLLVEWGIMKDLGYIINTTWTKGAGTLDWTTGNNWDIPLAPDAMTAVYLTNTGLAAGDTLSLGGNSTVAALVINSTVDFTLGGPSGTLTLAKGELTRKNTSSGSQQIARPITLAVSATWDVAGTGGLTVSGAISGIGILTKKGPGLLVLTGANTYVGSTTISAGTVRVTGGNALPDTFTVTLANVSGTSLELVGSDETIGAISGGGTLGGNVALGTATLRVGNGNSSSTFAGAVSGAGVLRKIGTGTLTLTSTANSMASVVVDAGTLAIGASGAFPAAASATVNSGALTFSSGTSNLTTASISNAGILTLGTGAALSAANLDGNGTVILQATSSLTANCIRQSTMNLQGTVVSPSALATIRESSPGLTSGTPSGSDSTVSVLHSLTIDSAAGTYFATFDLTNNDLLIDYTGGGSPLTTIEAMVRSGYHNGDWLGKGITSATAATNPGLYSLVVLDNATRPTPFNIFDGIDASSHQQVIVKFSWVADIDLDGLVTSNDAIAFAANYSDGAPANHQAGDLNYNGVFDSGDAILFATAYNESLPHLPEPASMSVLAIGAAALLMKRRKASRAIAPVRDLPLA